MLRPYSHKGYTVHYLYGMSRKSVIAHLANKGYPAVHAGALFSYLYQNRPLQGVPKNLYKTLEPKPHDQLLVDKAILSDDNSVKFLFTLQDVTQVESVLMPEKTRLTLCLSSQVGCQRACAFCHTGRMGLIRNLETEEIVGQLTSARRWIEKHPEWFNTAQKQGLLQVHRLHQL